MADSAVSSAWPVLHYDDPAAARRFLVDVVGFREAVVVRDDGGDIVHAELRWPGGGTVLFGGTKHTDSVHGGLSAGAVYVATDDVDAVHARLRRAGADVVQAPHPTEFAAGGPAYAFSVRDPEGNLWTFGTYRGVPDQDAPRAPTHRSRRLLAARVLLALATVGAVASSVGSVATVIGASADTRVVEAWRGLGLLFFGGVFTLLAVRPHAQRGLWEVTLLNKLLLTVVMAVLGATGAATAAWATAAADGVLTLLLVSAYVLVRGWRAVSSEVRRSR